MDSSPCIFVRPNCFCETLKKEKNKVKELLATFCFQLLCCQLYMYVKGIVVLKTIDPLNS
jgi:hypothetical protein